MLCRYVVVVLLPFYKVVSFTHLVLVQLDMVTKACIAYLQKVEKALPNTPCEGQAKCNRKAEFYWAVAQIWDSINNVKLRDEYYHKLVKMPWTSSVIPIIVSLIRKLLVLDGTDADIELYKTLLHIPGRGAACELQVSSSSSVTSNSMTAVIHLM